MIDTKAGEAALADFIDPVLLPNGTLAQLSGDQKASSRWLSSGLERQVAQAWETPANQLTCGQIRMLVGQRFGLQWLARSVAVFVAAYPGAECDLYPGDLSVNALRAFDDFLIFAAPEAIQMLGADFSWLEIEAASQPDPLLSDALGALVSGRAALGVGV